MTGHWVFTERGLSLEIDRADFERELQRALAWQVEFDRKVAMYRARYDALPNWRQFIYRWFSKGLGTDAQGYMKFKVLSLGS